MKRCKNCGAENLDEVKLCHQCGARFRDVLDAELDSGETLTDLTGVTLVDIRPQMVLGERYELVRELGRGAMGIVFLAKDRQLEINVAVKVLPPELGQSPRAVRRLKDEALAAMRLLHHNIVRLINFEESRIAGERVVRFITMEYVDGPTLARALEDAPGGAFDAERFLRYAGPICEAVAYAHGQKVIHGDLKPANVMLTSGEVVKVADFSIAHIVRDTMTRISKVETAGTLPYMAPELLLGGRGDPATDQYALGCTFYELLTGEPPFPRGDITFQHLSKEPEPIPDVPEHVSAAILRALAKKPEDRWPDVAAFGEALKSPRVGARRAVPLPAKPEPAPKPRAKRPPRTALYAGIAVALALLAAGVAWWVLQPKEITEEDRLRSTAMLMHGVYLAEKGNLDSARIVLEKAVELDSTNAEAHYRLGMVYQHTMRPLQAEESYRRAIAHDSLLTAAHFNLGQLYGQTERYEQAHRHFATVIRVDTSAQLRSLTYYCIGMTYGIQGDAVRAAEAYAKATEIDSLFARAYVGEGQELVRQGRYEEAIPVLRRALAIDSSLTIAYNPLATSYRMLDRMDEAVAAEEARQRALAREKAR